MTLSSSSSVDTTRTRRAAERGRQGSETGLPSQLTERPAPGSERDVHTQGARAEGPTGEQTGKRGRARPLPLRSHPETLPSSRLCRGRGLLALQPLQAHRGNASREGPSPKPIPPATPHPAAGEGPAEGEGLAAGQGCGSGSLPSPPASPPGPWCSSRGCTSPSSPVGGKRLGPGSGLRQGLTTCSIHRTLQGLIRK